MNTDIRNSKVVASLIVAMTAGAGLLLWMEPTPASANPPAALTALEGSIVENVTIQFAMPGEVDRPAIDVVLKPDGTVEAAQPAGTELRLVVVGADSPKELNLPQEQQRTLLTTLMRVAETQRGREVRVHLDPTSDAKLVPQLPPQAHDLRRLLALKGLIED